MPYNVIAKKIPATTGGLFDFEAQAEGGLVQGMGLMTIEELVYEESGNLLSNGFFGYKAPNIFFSPKKIDIEPLIYESNNLAIFSSKAVGEPPLTYAVGAYFAIEDAIRQFNPDFKQVFSSPLTPEKVLLSLYS